MKYPHVIEALYGHPWAAKPEAWYAAHNVFMRHLSGDLAAPTVPGAARPAKDWLGEPLEQMTIENGIARIPIKGVLIKGAGLLEKTCGVVSHEDIHEDLDKAESHKLRGIVLDINSPGGTVQGTPELASRLARIQESGIPVFAFTDTLMASAAYYLAAGATAIFASPSAIVGSIGVIWETYNVVESLKARGIEVNVFTSGPFKATGHPYTKVSDEQREWMQSHVDMLAEEFKKHVRTYRGEVEEETMQGQIFTGAEALRSHLVNGEARTIGEVVAMLS